MFSKFRAAWTHLTGGQQQSAATDEPSAAAVPYRSYRIRPTPYLESGQYQTAGVIEKDFAEGVKEHRFIRAERHSSKDDAAAFAIAKGKHIIDEQGDRIFDPVRMGGR